MATRNSVTAERLRELLTYDKNTGIFTRRIKRGNQPAGSSAGCLCPTHGYVLIGIDYVTYHASRLAWLYVRGKWPNGEIDHANRIRNDNRWSNLRLADHWQNACNSPDRLPNTSGFRGIVWLPKKKKWLSKVVAQKKQYYFGEYESAEDAAKAYDRGARRLHGPFAYQNFPITEEDFPQPH